MTKEQVLALLRDHEQANPAVWIPKLCGKILELLEIAEDHMKLLNALKAMPGYPVDGREAAAEQATKVEGALK